MPAIDKSKEAKLAAERLQGAHERHRVAESTLQDKHTARAALGTEVCPAPPVFESMPAPIVEVHQYFGSVLEAIFPAFSYIWM